MFQGRFWAGSSFRLEIDSGALTRFRQILPPVWYNYDSLDRGGEAVKKALAISFIILICASVTYGQTEYIGLYYDPAYTDFCYNDL